MVARIFHLNAYNLYDSLPVRAVRDLYGSRVQAVSPTEVQIQLGDNSFLYVYRFGAAAFFNVPPDQENAEIARLAGAFPQGVMGPTKESYDVQFGATADRVGLESVELHHTNAAHLGLVAMTLAQSAALEYFEIRAVAMLGDAAKILDRVAEAGTPPFGSKRLVRFIGQAAATRQNIVRNLVIVDPPESTWTSKDLQKLFRDLQQNFDLETRFKALDRNLSLVQDNIEILSDLANSRRAAMLEMLIILLILVEIALGLLGRIT